MEGDILGKSPIVGSVLANGIDSIHKVVHVCGVWTLDLVLCGPLEFIPPILRLEKSLSTGSIGNGGCICSLEPVIGEVDGVGQGRRFLDYISYELARLCERLC